MRIAYLSESLIPSRTANSIHVMRMCQALAKCGHEVVLLAPDSKNCDSEVKNVYAYYSVAPLFEIRKLRRPSFYSGRLIYDMEILLHLVRHRYDLVYGRYLDGCYLSTLLRNRTALEVHGPLWEFGKLQDALLEQTLKSIALCGLVVISEELRKIYAERFGAAGNMIVAHDGSDLPPTQEKYNLPGRDGLLHVGFVGHLYKGKGLEIIERIAPLLDDVNFHIVGGLERDIVYWKERIRDSNVFFHGFVEPRKISLYINAFDVCLLPLQREVLTHTLAPGAKAQNIASYTSPLKLFEYMAHGKAIVASDLPVIREVLNKDLAMLVPPEDIKGWVCALNALRNKRLRDEISAKAFKYFIENYSWDERARRLIASLSWLVGSGLSG